MAERPDEEDWMGSIGLAPLVWLTAHYKHAINHFRHWPSAIVLAANVQMSNIVQFRICAIFFVL